MPQEIMKQGIYATTRNSTLLSLEEVSMMAWMYSILALLILRVPWGSTKLLFTQSVASPEDPWLMMMISRLGVKRIKIVRLFFRVWVWMHESVCRVDSIRKQGKSRRLQTSPRFVMMWIAVWLLKPRIIVGTSSFGCQSKNRLLWFDTSMIRMLRALCLSGTICLLSRDSKTKWATLSV